MPGPATRQALLEQGALLFARERVANVTAKQLHAAVGARNESALHYHFGGKDGLVAEILQVHLAAIERRRARLVAAIEADGAQADVRALVHALASPMADDLDDALGRAHLRLVEQMSGPTLAYERPFQVVEAPAGSAVSRWLWLALADLPGPVRTERLAALRTQLISLFGRRAELLDQTADHRGPAATNDLFLANLLDLLVAGLTVAPSPAARAAASVGRPA